MSIRVQFGLMHVKEADWYQHIDYFPKLIKFLGKNYEWVFYDDDPSKQVDKILTFSELPEYDPDYGVFCKAWTELFPYESLNCECGAKHSSFSWDHMKFCRLWKPW